MSSEPAFPFTYMATDPNYPPEPTTHVGMSMRDYFAAKALANAAICTGSAPEYDLDRWFKKRGGITRAEIVAAQAFEYADAVIAARAITSRHRGSE